MKWRIGREVRVCDSVCIETVGIDIVPESQFQHDYGDDDDSAGAGLQFFQVADGCITGCS